MNACYRTMYSDSEIKFEDLAKAISAVLKIKTESISTPPDIGSKSDARVYAWIDEFKEGNFAKQIECQIDIDLMPATELDINGGAQAYLPFTRKLAIELQRPLTAEIPDFSLDGVLFFKCHPDGTEERIFPPEDDDDENPTMLQ